MKSQRPFACNRRQYSKECRQSAVSNTKQLNRILKSVSARERRVNKEKT
jgi:hypothetical protein